MSIRFFLEKDYRRSIVGSVRNQTNKPIGEFGDAWHSAGV